VLVARLGNRQRGQGESRKARVDDGRHWEFRAGVWIAVAAVEHDAAFANAIRRAALQPP
jgi:hypothetical protein